MKVIFHIDEPEKWSMVTSNVKNLLTHYIDQNEKITVEVLVNGSAVTSLKLNDQNYHNYIESILKTTAKIYVCDNSLVQRKILTDELSNDLIIVPSGVVELAEKQFEGYSYIKP
jgi:intracellular sulfur oxidation DsrE/DsrF family protein